MASIGEVAFLVACSGVVLLLLIGLAVLRSILEED